MDILYLPVSIGEAIDKLTILDIKCEKINDVRKKEVKLEFDMLYDKLKDIVNDYSEFYKIMKIINKDIWDMMDILRDNKNINNAEYYEKCKDCIDANDIRFRIKNKINLISNSLLKEQKSYLINNILFFITDLKINIHDLLNVIKYYSYIYDEVLIYSNDDNIINYFKKELYYDTTIKYVENIEPNIKTIFIDKYDNIDSLYDNLNITNDILTKYF